MFKKNLTSKNMENIIKNIEECIDKSNYMLLFRYVSNYKSKYSKLLSEKSFLDKLEEKKKNLENNSSSGRGIEYKALLYNIIIYIFSDMNELYKPNTSLYPIIVYKKMIPDKKFDNNINRELLELGLIVSKNEFK